MSGDEVIDDESTEECRDDEDRGEKSNAVVVEAVVLEGEVGPDGAECEERRLCSVKYV